jgi:hypothetical protein
VVKNKTLEDDIKTVVEDMVQSNVQPSVELLNQTDVYIQERNRINYKYDEDRYLIELTAYINETYNQHYSQNKFQATEFIIDSGLGTGFCMGNVMKYAQRYGRKGTPEDWRKDLLKVIHYAIMQLHVHELENGENHGN